jgi:hypothetical protein
MRKNLFVFALLAFVFSFAVNGQEQKRKITPEQRIEFRAKRLSKELLLDEKTSAKFVTLYKEYVAALKAAHPAKPEKKGEPTDAQRIERLQKRYEAQAKIANVNKEYVGKFSKILTAPQVEKVMSANGWQGKNRFAKQQGKRFNNKNAKGASRGKQNVKRDKK